MLIMRAPVRAPLLLPGVFSLFFFFSLSPLSPCLSPSRPFSQPVSCAVRFASLPLLLLPFNLLPFLRPASFVPFYLLLPLHLRRSLAVLPTLARTTTLANARPRPTPMDGPFPPDLREFLRFYDFSPQRVPSGRRSESSTNGDASSLSRFRGDSARRTRLIRPL